MLFEDMAEAIGHAHPAALDDVTRALWAAVSAGDLNEAQALRLSEAIDARRMLARGVQAAAGRGFLPVRVTPPRKHQRPPERSVAIERRRRLAASGPMPPALVARFTTGEAAVLRIVADEVKVRQVCALCLDAIAARAGVSRTTAQNAIRQAKRLGMVEVAERRRPGARSLPNLVRIIDREWSAWIRHHGFKKSNTTDKDVFERKEAARVSATMVCRVAPRLQYDGASVPGEPHAARVPAPPATRGLGS